MNALEILKSKSSTFAKNIKTIENAGYTIKYAKDFKMFDDVDNKVIFANIEGKILYTGTPKGFETTLIFADNEGREIRIDTSLIAKPNVSKLELMEMAELVVRTERFDLESLKVNTYFVEYSKGWESFERTSFRDLEKQIEELSYF